MKFLVLHGCNNPSVQSCFCISGRCSVLGRADDEHDVGAHDDDDEDDDADDGDGDDGYDAVSAAAGADDDYDGDDGNGDGGDDDDDDSDAAVAHAIVVVGDTFDLVSSPPIPKAKRSLGRRWARTPSSFAQICCTRRHGQREVKRLVT